ncbi:hypothetical protein HYU19_02560 [Candidatus Woesearchaeota archaeon]|nr:hypothetical protein [Candidatus Woesearchaeota archaeon]
MKNTIRKIVGKIGVVIQDAVRGAALQKTAIAMREAGAALLRQKKLAAGMMLLDAVFIILYGFVSAAYLPNILDFVVVVGSAISRHAVTNPNSNAGLFAMLRETGAMGAFWSLAILAITFLCSAFVLYTALSGSAWFLSRKALHPTSSPPAATTLQHTAYAAYLWRFAKVSLLWGVLALAGNVVSYLLDLRQTVVTGNVPTASSPFIAAYFILLVYVSSISYVSPYHGAASTSWGLIKQSAREGMSLWRKTIPAMIAIALLYLAIHKILVLAHGVNPTLSLVLGILLVFPLFSFARVFFGKTLEERT